MKKTRRRSKAKPIEQSELNFSETSTEEEATVSEQASEVESTPSEEEAQPALKDILEGIDLDKLISEEDATQEEEAPVQEVEESTKEEKAPVQEVEEPAKKEEAPVQEVEEPAKKEEAPVQEAEEPAKEEEAPVQEEAPKSVIKLAPKISSPPKKEVPAYSSPIDYESSFVPESEENTTAPRSHSSSGRRRRRSSSEGGRRSSSSRSRSRSSSNSKMLKYAIYGTVAVIVFLGCIISVMMVRQSTLRTASKQAREARAAKLQEEAQKELRENNIASTTKPHDPRAAQNAEIPSFTGKKPLSGSTLDLEDSGNELFNPDIFNLPSDTDKAEGEALPDGAKE